MACSLSETVGTPSLPVPVLGEQVPLDALHEVLEPGRHARLLGRRLPLDDLVTQLFEVLCVQQDEAEEGARHRPLVPVDQFINQPFRITETIDITGLTKSIVC